MALIGEKVVKFGKEHYVDAFGKLVRLNGDVVDAGIKVEGYDIKNIATLVLNNLLNEQLIDERYNDFKDIADSIVDTLTDILLK